MISDERKKEMVVPPHDPKPLAEADFLRELRRLRAELNKRLAEIEQRLEKLGG